MDLLFFFFAHTNSKRKKKAANVPTLTIVSTHYRLQGASMWPCLLFIITDQPITQFVRIGGVIDLQQCYIWDIQYGFYGRLDLFSVILGWLIICLDILEAGKLC